MGKHEIMPYKDNVNKALNSKSYYWKNREAILARRATQKYCPIKKHNQHLKRRYGITLDDYERMFKEQAGLCGICSKGQVGGRRLHVDHDHDTGKVRGLLCYGCNSSLGRFEKYRDKIDVYLAGEISHE